MRVFECKYRENGKECQKCSGCEQREKKCHGWCKTIPCNIVRCIWFKLRKEYERGNANEKPEKTGDHATGV